MTTTHSSPWQQALANAVTNRVDLYQLLALELPDTELKAQAQDAFALRVPHAFISRMTKGNLSDPLLLQVLPQAIEMLSVENFSTDPLQETHHNPVPGLLHKYPNRVLLTLTGGCAINCRYCFRRHFPYDDNLPGRANWHHTLAYIAANDAIDEVILSGGDPLMLKDHVLAEFVTQLEKITHVTRLRIHTRLPIVIPERVTTEWIAWMKQSRFCVVVVVHCNHANEIDDAVVDAMQQLRTAGITVLNQSVLLKHVNDTADALVQLSKRLFEAGMLPYYLHLLDKVQGAAHFDVPEEKANALIAAIKTQLPGYLVPRLVREVPNLLSKKFI